MRMNIIDHDLLSIQEARILAENALEAQRTLATFPQEKLDEIVERMAEEISKHSKELAVMSSEETDYGNWQDKYIKNRFACEYRSGKTDHGRRGSYGGDCRALPGYESGVHYDLQCVDRD